MPDLELVGGALCLDLVNTVHPRHAPAPDDHLDSYAALAAWAVHAGALDAATARRLRTAGATRPAQAERVRARAASLRETLHALFAPGGPTAAVEDSLGVLTEELRQGCAHAVIERAGEDYVLAFAAGDALDRMLWPVARSALELLLSTDRRRVKECAEETCGRLFVDRSRAGRRVWCSMASCGNRAKVQRYRERTHRERG